MTRRLRFSAAVMGDLVLAALVLWLVLADRQGPDARGMTALTPGYYLLDAATWELLARSDCTEQYAALPWPVMMQRAVLTSGPYAGQPVDYLRRIAYQQANVWAIKVGPWEPPAVCGPAYGSEP